MALEMLFGGVSLMEFDVAGGNFAAPICSVSAFTREGNTWPTPEAVTDGLSNDQQGPTGQRVPFVVMGVNVDAANADTLRGKGFTLDLVDVRFTPKTGAKKMVVKNVVIRVETAAIAEYGKYGTVRFEGEGTAAGATKAYTWA